MDTVSRYLDKINFNSYLKEIDKSKVALGATLSLIAIAIGIIWKKTNTTGIGLSACNLEGPYKNLKHQLKQTPKVFNTFVLDNELGRMKSIVNEKLTFLSTRKVFARFDNISCPSYSSVPYEIDGKRLHANYVGDADNSRSTLFKRYIATQFPLANTEPLYWDMVFKEGAVIVDLTNGQDVNKYKLNPFFLTEIGETKKFRYGKHFITVTLNEINDTHLNHCKIHKYKVTNSKTNESRNIDRIHYQGWNDQKNIKVKDADTLVGLINEYKENNNQVPIINCSAGMDRTGTLCAALGLKANTKLSDSNYLHKTLKLVFKYKTQRGPDCVGTPSQLAFLGNYAKFLTEMLVSEDEPESTGLSGKEFSSFYRSSPKKMSSSSRTAAARTASSFASLNDLDSSTIGSSSERDCSKSFLTPYAENSTPHD